MATIDTKDSPRSYGPNADYPSETGYSVPRQPNNDMLGWGIFAIVVAAVVLFGAYHYRNVITGTPTETSYSTTTGESSNSMTDTSGNAVNRDSSAAMPGSDGQSNTLASPSTSGSDTSSMSAAPTPQTAPPADNATGSVPSSGTSTGSQQGGTY